MKARFTLGALILAVAMTSVLVAVATRTPWAFGYLTGGGAVAGLFLWRAYPRGERWQPGALIGSILFGAAVIIPVAPLISLLAGLLAHGPSGPHRS